MTTTPRMPNGWQGNDFVSTDDLVRQQGIEPIAAVSDLAADIDPFESDEEYAAFLADLYTSRRAGIT